MKFTIANPETVTALLVLEESVEFAKSVHLEQLQELMEIVELVELTNNLLMVNAFALKVLFQTILKYVQSAVKYLVHFWLMELALFVLEILHTMVKNVHVNLDTQRLELDVNRLVKMTN